MADQSIKVLRDRAAALKGALEAHRDRGDGPIPAIDLADACGFRSDKRETLRRLVRVVVTHAREQEGMRICANAHGCWLARSGEEWRQYTDAIKAKTTFKFVRMAKVKRALNEAHSGQGRLFDRAPEGSRRAEWARA